MTSPFRRPQEIAGKALFRLGHFARTLPERLRWARALRNGEAARWHARAIHGLPNYTRQPAFDYLALRNGVRWRVADSGSAYVFEEIFLDRVYASPAVARATTIVDVGANIGLFTLFARLRNPTARILSVEAAPGNARILRHNVADNRLAGIEIVECAAGGTDGTASFYVAAGNSGWGSLTRDGNLQMAEVTVPKRKLSSLLRERDIAAVDFLKCDIEGGEYEVFLGDEDLRHVPIGAAILELDATPRDPRFTNAEMIAALHQRWARVEKICGGRYPVFRCTRPR